MKIRFVKAWRGYPRGAVATMGGGVADVLLRRGVAVEDGAASAVRESRTIETAALEPAATVRTADATPKRRAKR